LVSTFASFYSGAGAGSGAFWANDSSVFSYFAASEKNFGFAFSPFFS